MVVLSVRIQKDFSLILTEITAGVVPCDGSEVCFDGSIAQWQRQCTQNARSVCSNQTGATILYNFNLAQYSAKDAGRTVNPMALLGLERYQGVPPIFTIFCLQTENTTRFILCRKTRLMIDAENHVSVVEFRNNRNRHSGTPVSAEGLLSSHFQSKLNQKNLLSVL